MATNEASFFSRAIGVFKRKKTAKEAIEELGLNARELDREISGLDYDMKGLNHELSRCIQQGVNAAAVSNAAEAKKAASNVRLAKAKLAMKQRSWNVAMKSKTFCELTKMHLESAQPDGVLARMTELTSLMEDSELARMAMSADVGLNEFEAKVSRMLSQMEAGSKSFADRSDFEDDEILREFQAIAEAEKAGDSQAVNESRSRLTGAPENPEAV